MIHSRTFCDRPGCVVSVEGAHADPMRPPTGWIGLVARSTWVNQEDQFLCALAGRLFCSASCAAAMLSTPITGESTEWDIVP